MNRTWNFLTPTLTAAGLLFCGGVRPYVRRLQVLRGKKQPLNWTGHHALGGEQAQRARGGADAAAEALRQAALQILPGTYFHALGLDIAATAPEVQRAYEEVASRFNPDGFAEYDVGDLEDLLAAVQDKVTAAFRVLSNDEKRRAYLSFLMLKFELAGARRPGIDVDAEIALKRGERALVMRRNAEAVAALARSVERNPKEPEYHAMLGFAELHDPVLPRSQRAAEARKCARKALQLDPEHARAIAVLALAEATAGDAAEARKVVVAGLRTHPAARMLFYVMGLGWLFTTVLFVALSSPAEIGRLSVTGWLSIGFLGIFCSGLGYILWYAALPGLTAAPRMVRRGYSTTAWSAPERMRIWKG